MTEQTRLLVLDDISSRNFPFWASKIIDSKEDSSPLDWSMMDEAGIDEQVSSVCISLLKVGQALSSMSKV
jgi:hypothetical protein